MSMPGTASTTPPAGLDSPGREGRCSPVRLPPDRRLDVLLLCRNRRILDGLLQELQRTGFGVDLAQDVLEARSMFFGAGGHHCLLVAPDVAPGVAGQVLHTLRAVDPELPLATFGPRGDTPRAPCRTAQLAGYHPSSRAGIGAFLRFLRALPERG